MESTRAGNLTRAYSYTAVDPIYLARALGVGLEAVGRRMGVTVQHVRYLAKSAHHAGRVKRAVLELAVEAERLEAFFK